MDVLAKGHFPDAYPYEHDPGASNVSPGPPTQESLAMNIAMRERKPAQAQPLKEVSLITGSTSGIGLGIAWGALAGASSAIVLNGFRKLAINLSSAFRTTRLSLPSMIANKWGRIINIASPMDWSARPINLPMWQGSTVCSASPK